MPLVWLLSINRLLLITLFKKIKNRDINPNTCTLKRTFIVIINSILKHHLHANLGAWICYNKFRIRIKLYIKSAALDEVSPNNANFYRNQTIKLKPNINQKPLIRNNNQTINLKTLIRLNYQKYQKYQKPLSITQTINLKPNH